MIPHLVTGALPRGPRSAGGGSLSWPNWFQPCSLLSSLFSLLTPLPPLSLSGPWDSLCKLVFLFIRVCVITIFTWFLHKREITYSIYTSTSGPRCPQPSHRDMYVRVWHGQVPHWHFVQNVPYHIHMTCIWTDSHTRRWRGQWWSYKQQGIRS